MNDPNDLTGRFSIEREVGRGGGGAVYRGTDLTDTSTVALKIALEEGELAEHLLAEGRLLSRLDSEHIVRVVAWGQCDDLGTVLALEWLEGVDLATRLARGPLPIVDAVSIARHAARGLAHAHSRGVVHGDVKPANVFLCEEPACVKLVDFGVALVDGQPLTGDAPVFGTPSYMAPEQARGDRQLDFRCDLYSLGATLFELVCGRPPHVAPTNIATLARLVLTPPPRMSFLKSGLPRDLDEIVAELLAIDPSERPQDMSSVADRLAEIEESPSLQGSRTTEPMLSMRLGSGATRLVTTLVAVDFATSKQRDEGLEQLRELGADAVPLTRDALVAHFGARRTMGTEAVTALDRGCQLAAQGASVGIASGRARVAAQAEVGGVHAVGDVVDRASSLAREAGRGEVLADTTTSELGRGRFEFRRRNDGTSIVGPAVRGPRVEQVGGAPFVGRETELAKILNSFSRSMNESTPVVTTISGASGMGKSRLRREALARVFSRGDGPELIIQRSASYGRQDALGAASDVLRSLLGLPRGATAADAKQALLDRMPPQTRSETSERSRELLAIVLSNESLPEEDHLRARDLLWLTMTDLVLEAVAERPLAIVLEDIQWADEESIGWVDHVLGRAGGLPLHVIAVARPDFWQQDHRRFSGRDHVRIDLQPMSPRTAAALARAVWGSSATDEEVSRLVKKSGGLPLFTEELARLAASGADTENTATIESVIQASLDSLGEEQRDAIGRLSVLGQRVWDAGLEALGFTRAAEVMQALTAAEVLVEQHSSRFSGAREWTFKHGLVQEVAYSSLGKEEARELHALAAQWLAGMGEDAAVVAEHFDNAGLEDRAAKYWGRAARRALAANALRDALHMAERALAFSKQKPDAFAHSSVLDEAWARLDPNSSERESAIWALEENVYDERSEVRARGARARYDNARGASVEIAQRLAAVRDQAADLELRQEEAHCSAVLAARLAFAGDFRGAEAEANRLLTLADVHQVRSAGVDGWQTLAITRQTQGALNAALEARRNAARAARQAGLRDREATLTANLGFALTTIGARKEARELLQNSLDLADALGSPGTQRHAKMILMCWASTFGSDARVDALLTDARREADDAALSAWTNPARENLGSLYYRACELLANGTDRDLDRAIALFRLTTEAYRQTDNRDVLAVALGMWSTAALRAGNAEEALALAREGAELLARGAPSLLNESTVYLALCDAFTALGKAEEARQAIETAMVPLLRRLKGLVGTPYARQFLTEVPTNSRLISMAEGFGLVPDNIYTLLESSA